MSIIIVALPKIEDANKIRTILIRHGYDNIVPCCTASAALIATSREGTGLIICACRLPDMHYTQLLECMPPYYQMLIVGRQSVIGPGDNNVMALTTPLKAYDLVNTVEMLLTQLERRYKKQKKKLTVRSEKEENYIRNAKLLLMDRNHLTEAEAHRYLQKWSMDSGTNLVETAQMILRLIFDEG